MRFDYSYLHHSGRIGITWPGFNAITARGLLPGTAYCAIISTTQSSEFYTLQTTVQPPTVNAQRPKKKCMLSDCPDPVAPSMWHQHMSLHASGYYSGRVPNSWLKDQHLFACSSCHQLVSISRTASHSRCCREQAKSPATLTAVSASSPTEPNQGLPSFEEVCQLRRPVLRFVPARDHI